MEGSWFDDLFSFIPQEFGAKELVVQAFPVFLIAEALRLLVFAGLSIIPAIFKGKNREMADELIKKIANFLGYGGNIWASFFLAGERGLSNDTALLYGGVSIIMHLIWTELIYEKWVKRRMRMRG